MPGGDAGQREDRELAQFLDRLALTSRTFPQGVDLGFQYKATTSGLAVDPGPLSLEVTDAHRDPGVPEGRATCGGRGAVAVGQGTAMAA
jgi:hypothetical protein